MTSYSNPNPFLNQINPQTFARIIPQLNSSQINELVSAAKQQGISENDIRVGLEFLKSFIK